MFLPLGVEENSLDSFVFDTLIPKPITQRYFNLLMEHHRIILSGPSGTGKTYLAHKLAEYVITKSGRKKTEGMLGTAVITTPRKHLQTFLPLRRKRADWIILPSVFVGT